MQVVNYSKLNDEELVILLKEGNQLAYTEIFKKYNKGLYRHAFRMLNDHEEVNDLTQDLFLSLWQRRETIIFKTSLASYLYTSTRNRVFDKIEHHKVASRYLDSIRDFISQGSYITDEQIREKELASIIEKEINALPVKMREVFKLNRQEGFSYKDIAEQLNISDKTAKQQVYNAVKILKLKFNFLLTTIIFF